MANGTNMSSSEGAGEPRKKPHTPYEGPHEIEMFGRTFTYESKLADPNLEVDSHLVAHAKAELDRIGNGPMIDTHVLDIVRIFASGGHSGHSAPYVAQIIFELLSFNQLGPLTTDPEEWHFHEGYLSAENGDKGFWQNRRNGAAFSYDGGKTYYLTDDPKIDGPKGTKVHAMYESIIHTYGPREVSNLERVADNERVRARVDELRALKRREALLREARGPENDD